MIDPARLGLAVKTQAPQPARGVVPRPRLDAQRDLYLAKRDYEQSRYDYLIYRMRLKQAVGTLAEGDILSVSDALR